MVAKPFVSPEVDFSKIPTFDELFKQWYDLQIKSKRWTHKASIQRPIGAYTNHAQQALVICQLQRSRGVWFLAPCRRYS